MRRSGLLIRDVNVRTPFGEIDILAEGPKGFVVVEVRGRSRAGWRPIEALNWAKKRRLNRLALWVQGRERRPAGVVLVEIVGVPPKLPAWVLGRWPERFGLKIKDYPL